MSAAPLLALVTPWFGPETRGGAEHHARRLAYALKQSGADLEVWTTQCRDSFAPGAAHYPVGRQELDGLLLRRFPMDAPALGVPPLLRERARALPAFPDHEINLLASLPNSAALYRHMLAHPERRCLLLPYPMGMTFWGAALARGRSYLMPCLHDEPYARYSTYRYLFRSVERALFLSAPERDLALRLYDLDPARCVVAGSGVEMHWHGDAERFRQRYGLPSSEHMLLYSGRHDTGKNLPLLLSYFREYRARTARPLRLVLSGPPGPVRLPQALDDWALDIGYVDDQTKHDAYAAATIFCQPSTIESFSLVLMEAWLQATPALVSARCPVTSEHCLRSGAGLPFEGFEEFAACLDLLLDQPELRRRMGQAGQSFVQRECRWEDVARRTLEALGA